MDFVVRRSKWRCGSGGDHRHGTGVTLLLDSNGLMCCLGHCALQLGVKKKQIFGISMPGVCLNVKVLTHNRKTNNKNTKLSLMASEINDNTSYTDEQREEELRKLFKKFKHTITFVGRFPKK